MASVSQLFFSLPNASTTVTAPLAGGAAVAAAVGVASGVAVVAPDGVVLLLQPASAQNAPSSTTPARTTPARISMVAQLSQSCRSFRAALIVGAGRRGSAAQKRL